MLCFAVFALAPSTTWFGRKVIDLPYDDGGFLYTGTLKAGKFNGRGKIFFAGGGGYEGEFLEGRFQGFGIFSGDDWRFEGIFNNGVPQRGTLHTKAGKVTVEPGGLALEGQWDYTGTAGPNGQRGQGEFTFADGAVYKGGFRGGLAEGQGTYYDADGRKRYEGGWSAGLYEGEGSYAAPDGSFAYQGGFRGGKFEGKGTVTAKDGKTTAGTWNSGWRVKK